MTGRIATVLAALDQARQIDDLNRPSFRLHALKGDMAIWRYGGLLGCQRERKLAIDFPI